MFVVAQICIYYYLFPVPIGIQGCHGIGSHFLGTFRSPIISIAIILAANWQSYNHSEQAMIQERRRRRIPGKPVDAFKELSYRIRNYRTGCFESTFDSAYAFNRLLMVTSTGRSSSQSVQSTIHEYANLKYVSTSYVTVPSTSDDVLPFECFTGLTSFLSDDATLTHTNNVQCLPVHGN